MNHHPANPEQLAEEIASLRIRGADARDEMDELTRLMSRQLGISSSRTNVNQAVVNLAEQLVHTKISERNGTASPLQPHQPQTSPRTPRSQTQHQQRGRSPTARSRRTTTPGSSNRYPVPQRQQAPARSPSPCPVAFDEKKDDETSSGKTSAPTHSPVQKKNQPQHRRVRSFDIADDQPPPSPAKRGAAGINSNIANGRLSPVTDAAEDQPQIPRSPGRLQIPAMFTKENASSSGGTPSPNKLPPFRPSTWSGFHPLNAPSSQTEAPGSGNSMENRPSYRTRSRSPAPRQDEDDDNHAQPPPAARAQSPAPPPNRRSGRSPSPASRPDDGGYQPRQHQRRMRSNSPAPDRDSTPQPAQPRAASQSPSRLGRDAQRQDPLNSTGTPFQGGSIEDDSVFKTAIGKHRRKAGTTPAFLSAPIQPQVTFASEIGNDDGGFQIGAAPRNQRNTKKVSVPDQSDLFSPMDIDTPANPSATTDATVGAFNLGSSTPASRSTFRRYRNVQTPGISPLVKTAIYTPKASEDANNNGVMARVASLRESAKNAYSGGLYASGVRQYSMALEIIGQHDSFFSSNISALLYSNRAACLMMIGAHQAAASDCEKGLRMVTEAKQAGDVFTNDAGPPLKIKILNRLGRSFLKLGLPDQAKTAFCSSVSEATEAIKFCQTHFSVEDARSMEQHIRKMMTEASIGQTDSEHLASHLTEITTLSEKSRKDQQDKKIKLEALGRVAMALSIASSSVELFKAKVELLFHMQRWRELVDTCGRWAAAVVKLDGVSGYDLQISFPFVEPPHATHLKPDFFNSQPETTDYELPQLVAKECALRLPSSIQPVFCRALRLEMRFEAAMAVLRSLHEIARPEANSPGWVREQLAWVAVEFDKLNRTSQGYERGTELYNRGEFDLAAAEYNVCLEIDGEGSLISGNAGGRLHAVCHSNRAVCLMNFKHFHQALEECTKALRVHPRYMKSIRRRGRCYRYLGRYDEAINEYKHFIGLVEEERSRPAGSPSPYISSCIFDGPRETTDNELESVKTELENAIQSKRKAEAQAQEEAERRKRQHQWRQDFNKFNQSSQESKSGAQQRRDRYYSQHGASFDWDPFSGRGPRSSATGSSHYWRSETDENRSGNRGHHRRSNSMDSPGSPKSSCHYSILKVATNASEDDIKKAYRVMAKKYHPDRNQDVEAQEKMRSINEAFEILSDPQKKRSYDRSKGYNQRYF